jgi:hypothetical protein
LRKSIISFVMSICSSIRLCFHMEQLGSHWADFHEVRYLRVKTSVEKSKIPLKSDKNYGYFTRRAIYSFGHMSLSSYWNEKCFSHKLYRKSKHTLYFVLLTVHLGIIFVNNQPEAQFFSMYVYFYSLHVSGSHEPIIRKINCISTTSGICHSV